MDAEALMRQMERINEIAQEEKSQNIPILQAGVDFWTAVAQELERNEQALGTAASRVAEQWRDATQPVAFGEPVEAGRESMSKSVQTIMQANPQQAAQDAIGEIEKQAPKIAELLEQFITVKNLADQIRPAAENNRLGYEAQMLAQLEAKMRELVADGLERLRKIEELGYGEGTGSVRAAGQGHVWNGSRSASTVSAAAVDGSGTTTVSAGTGSPGENAQQSTAESIGKAETMPIGAGDPTDGETGSGTGAGTDENHYPAEDDRTGLAGGPGAAPATPTTNVPPAAPPPAGTGTAGAGVPITPVAGAGALGRAAGTGPVTIPRAAKVSGGLVSASSGTAPVLPADPASTTAASGARKHPMGAGVPPMLGAPLATGGLPSLINRLKPILGRQILPPVQEPESVPGVPKGLRGRTAHVQDDDAFRQAPRPLRSRRSSSTDTPPETVQLLDEEIWQIEQASASTATVADHR